MVVPVVSVREMLRQAAPAETCRETGGVHLHVVRICTCASHDTCGVHRYGYRAPLLSLSGRTVCRLPACLSTAELLCSRESCFPGATQSLTTTKYCSR